MRKTDCIVVDSLAQKMMAKSNVLDSIGRFCREGEAEIGRKRSRCLAAVSATRSKQLTKSVLLRQVKRSRSLAIDTETEEVTGWSRVRALKFAIECLLERRAAVASNELIVHMD